MLLGFETSGYVSNWYKLQMQAELALSDTFF